MNAPYTNSDPCWRGLGVLDGAKVLLVEDDPATRWLVRSALRDKCRLATANTANKAFSICQSYKPDIVFLDIQMNGETGFDLLLKVGEINFAVVFTTAYDNYALRAIKFCAIRLTKFLIVIWSWWKKRS